jgi:hypothetical protein
LIAALLAGQLQVEAARAARISERTAQRLVAQPYVRRALRERRNQAIAGAVTRLAASAFTAAATLTDLSDLREEEEG